MDFSYGFNILGLTFNYFFIDDFLLGEPLTVIFHIFLRIKGIKDHLDF